MAISTTNLYLEGAFAPIHDEISVDRCEVIGELPPDLAGMFVRNGSNPRFAPKGRYHWFDGDGMLHGVHIEDGVARYANRYVQTEGLRAETDAGEALWTGIMERPDLTNPGGPFKNTANTDLVFHAGRLLALWWLGGDAYEIAVPSLDTIGRANIGAALASHPKLDPVTGELVFFDYSMMPPYLTYGVVDADGQLVHHEPIDLPGPRLLHDIAITQQFTVLLDFPLMWDPELLARGKTKVIFRDDVPARIGVLPRRGTNNELRWFETSPCYMYHTVNAWEEGDEIVLVGCRIENPMPGAIENPRNLPRLDILQMEPYFHEWRLDLVTGAVRERQLDDTLTEFPRMDNRVLGRASRYSYHPRVAHGQTLRFDAVVKYDLATGHSAVHEYGGGRVGGETAFAPRVGSVSEDDGYVLTFVTDEHDGASELCVLDAQRVEAGPVARVLFPHRVPIGYHTWWIAADDLAGNAP